jgi:hypothetical protein
MEKELTATYIGNSKNYCLFLIDEDQELTGALYVPRNKPVPHTVRIRLRTEAGAEQKPS